MESKKFVCKYEEYTKESEILSLLNQIKSTIKLTPMLIGSRALQLHFPSYRAEEFSKDSYGYRKDYDLIVDVPTAKSLIPNLSSYSYSYSYDKPAGYHGATLTIFYLPDASNNLTKHYKLYISRSGSNLDVEIVTSVDQSAYLIASSSSKTKIVIEPHMQVNVAEPEILEVIKASHIYHPHNFSKHIRDLHAIRRLMSISDTSLPTQKQIDFIKNENNVGQLPQRSEDLEKILKIRSTEIDAKKGVPGDKVKLNMTNDDFLEKEANLLVEKMIKHDDIHELVKFGNYPMYTKLKEDQSKATCLRRLWDQLTYQEQLQDVMEEAMVLALERYLFPEYVKDEQVAYDSALTRICTTITKGWFRKFAVDNWPAVKTCPKPIKSMAVKVIHDYQHQQEIATYIKPSKPPSSLYSYFDVDEYVVASQLASLIEEIYDDRDHPESDDDKSGSDIENSEVDENEDSKTEKKLRPIKKWVNKGHDRYTISDLSNYGGDYNHSNHSYEFPSTIRKFRIHASASHPEMWVKVKTDHNFTVHDCSESISWTAGVIITPPGETTKETQKRMDSSTWSLKYDKLEPHYLDFNISCHCSDGMSEYSGTGVNINIDAINGDIKHSIILRTLLAVMSPHMIPAGEILLGKYLGDTDDDSTPCKHPWYMAFLRKN